MPISRIGTAVTFFAFYVASKTGKTGLTVTVDVYRRSDGALVVNGGSATALGGGLYYYTLAGASTTPASEYAAIFKTADSTVDQQHLPALWVVGREWTENLDAAITSRPAAADYTTARAAKLDNLDVSVGSRLAAGSYSPPPSASAIADQVWDETLSEHAGAGSTGAALAGAGAAGDPLLNEVPGNYASGTAGHALGRVGAAPITVVSPVDPETAGATVYQGRDYYAADGLALEWTSTTWPNLTAATAVTFTVNSTPVLTGVATVVNAGQPTQKLRVELSRAQTTALPVGSYRISIKATLADTHVPALVEARLTVLRVAA